MPFGFSSSSGWGQYVAPGTYYLVIAIGTGIVATISSLSARPLVSLFAGAASSVMFNTFILTGLQKAYAETAELEGSIIKKHPENKTGRLALQDAKRAVGSFWVTKALRGTSTAVSILSLMGAAAQIGIAITIAADKDKLSKLTAPEANIPLALINSISLLVGFPVLNTLTARIPLLKEQIEKSTIAQMKDAGYVGMGSQPGVMSDNPGGGARALEPTARIPGLRK